MRGKIRAKRIYKKIQEHRGWEAEEEEEEEEEKGSGITIIKKGVSFRLYSEIGERTRNGTQRHSKQLFQLCPFTRTAAEWTVRNVELPRILLTHDHMEVEESPDYVL